MSDEASKAQMARLKWRCRRGMRELDVVLSRYLGECFPDDSPDRQAAFEQLLELPDPELFDLLRGHSQAATSDGKAIVEALRRSHPS